MAMGFIPFSISFDAFPPFGSAISNGNNFDVSWELRLPHATHIEMVVTYYELSQIWNELFKSLEQIGVRKWTLVHAFCSDNVILL